MAAAFTMAGGVSERLRGEKVHNIKRLGQAFEAWCGILPFQFVWRDADSTKAVLLRILGTFMRLHSKTIGVLILAFMLLLASAVGFYFFYVLQDVLNIEREIALGNASRVQGALKAELEKTKSTAIDWGCWDDTYEAMVKMTPKYIESWGAYESFAALGLSEAIFFDLKRRAALALRVDYTRQEVAQIKDSDQMVRLMAQNARAFGLDAENIAQAHFSDYDGRPAILASSEIQNSNHSKPSRGTLVLVKFIDTAFIEKLAEQVQLNITSSSTPPGWADRLGVSIRTPEPNLIEVQIPILSPDRTPIFYLQFSSPRPIYQQAWHTLEIFVSLWICASSLVLALAGFLLNRLVIGRLRLVSEKLSRVHQDRRFDEAIEVNGSDEIAEMTSDINSMLAALSESHYYEVLNARDKAQAASQAKTNFMAKVSHELRTPIHGILGIVGIMWRNSPDEETRLHLGMVRDSAVGLLGVVNDVLDFSKSECGELSVVLESTDIRDAVRRALRVVGPRLFERSESEPLECIAVISPQVPARIVTDGKRITQILVNFLANGIKFTRTGLVQVNISWRALQDNCGHLECIVRDTGIGIPSENLMTLFEPFRQVDDSVNRAYQGTGLGLAIVKQLVTALHGTVSVASQVGVGSNFRFMIPVVFDKSSPQQEGASLSGACVWMQLDRPIEHEEIAAALREAGATVDEFKNRPVNFSKDGVAEASSEYLVLSAFSLTRGSVWSVLEAFIEQVGPERVVVLVSAHQLTYRERLRSLGVDRMILTPVVAQDVVGSLLGTFREDFSGYDDYVDIVPNLHNPLEILVADDLLTNQIVLKCILQDMGHRVTVVSNGQELLDSLKPMFGQRQASPEDRQFDMVLTDLQMPVMDGISALKIIREWEKQQEKSGDRLPVFLVTAHALDDERSMMFEAGASEVVTKPIDIKKLEGAIKTFAATIRR